MFAGKNALSETNQTVYVQDDITRGLRITLVAALFTAMANDRTDPAFLKGALSMARIQAALYGIPWHEVMENLCYAPEMCCLVQKLEGGVRQV